MTFYDDLLSAGRDEAERLVRWSARATVPW
jgi:hypothetical protein